MVKTGADWALNNHRSDGMRTAPSLLSALTVVGENHGYCKRKTNEYSFLEVFY